MSRWLKATLLLAAALASPELFAQATTPSDAVAARNQQFMKLWLSGLYLAAIASIEEGWETAPPQVRSNYTQFRPALDGFVVITPELRQPLPKPDPAELARYRGAQASDAVAEIVRRAHSTRVVIVNEAHDNPRDRAFILSVAQALKPLGYNVYAAETLGNWGSDAQKAERLHRLVADGYPDRDTGTYSAEPMFGDLIRGVLRLGYRPVAYEAAFSAETAQLPRDEQIARRERGEAENLARAIAAAGPEAKFLIHVGYHHAAERPLGPAGHREDWMAARFARLTGIDPLTVDQTDLSEFSGDPKARALYAALEKRVGAIPMVFMKDGQAVRHGELGQAVDLQVVHPRIRSVGGRPDWLQRTGRKAIRVPRELMPRTGRALIQVFGKDEPDEAIPIDQVLVSAGVDPPLVYVPKEGAIRWAVQTG
jgi:hypothetical protein